MKSLSKIDYLFPKEVIVSVTSRCNLRCRMCDIWKSKKKELTTEIWKRFIDDISAVGVKTIVFSGGEPLLRQDIFELIAYSREKKLNVCLTSNGTLIDNDIADKLLSSGIGVVNISLEGPSEVHNYLRGGGSFEKAVAALEKLRQRGIETTVATVVS